MLKIWGRVPSAFAALIMLVAGMVFVSAAVAGATGDDAVTSAVAGCDGNITFTSTKDLSNIIIQYADGFEIKLEDGDLSGKTHTTDYVDPEHGAIVKVWIHSGNNHNDSDPQPTNFGGNSVGEYHSVSAPDCGTTTTTYVTPTTEYVSPTTEYVSPTTEYVSPTTEYVSPTTEYVSPTTEYVSPTTEYVSPTTEYVSPTTEHVTPTTVIENEGESSTLPTTSTTGGKVVVKGDSTTTTVAAGAAATPTSAIRGDTKTGALPFTGGNSFALLMVGLALVAAGTLTFVGRRRATDLDIRVK